MENLLCSSKPARPTFASLPSALAAASEQRPVLPESYIGARKGHELQIAGSVQCGSSSCSQLITQIRL